MQQTKYEKTLTHHIAKTENEKEKGKTKLRWIYNINISAI
jgi:hypothetical protein